MKATDILDTIDAVLAENRQVKQRRMQAHVMWLLDNPTQLALNLWWDESTTEITEQDIEMVAAAASYLFKFDYPNPGPLCVCCLSYQVEGDYPWCGDGKCSLFSPESIDLAPDERCFVLSADIADLPQPLHRGHVHVQPMVSAS